MPLVSKAKVRPLGTLRTAARWRAMTTKRNDPEAHDTDRQHRADVAAHRRRLARIAARAGTDRTTAR